MVQDTSVDTIDMFEDLEPYADIIADKWYIVSTQGVEAGPYDTYRMAKDDCKEDCLSPMYGEQILDLEEDEFEWFTGEDPTIGGW